MNKKDIKDVLTSILVGAVIAFLTVFMEGALDYLQGLENNIMGSVGGAILYVLKHRIWT